jgi:hypothetical protein
VVRTLGAKFIDGLVLLCPESDATCLHKQFCPNIFFKELLFLRTNTGLIQAVVHNLIIC